jgi:multimeric flavodoxin WrbA
MIYGNSLQGVSYHYGEMLLSKFPKGTIVERFDANDLPSFCLSCKNCILKGENRCVEAKKTQTVFASMLSSDLIVFSYPVYALNVPASVKSLLDHLCYAWMVHRPNEDMFKKKIIILTNSVGMAFQQKLAIKSVRIAMNWMGASYVRAFPVGMMGDVIWGSIKDDSVKKLDESASRAFGWYERNKDKERMKAGTKFKFFVCKKMHQSIYESSTEVSLDNQRFLDKKWIKAKKNGQ